MDTQNQIFSDYSLKQSQTHAVSKSFMASVFLWMGGALLISAFFAWLFATNATYASYLIEDTYKGPALTGFGWFVMFAPIGFVLLMNLGVNKLSLPVLALLFVAFAAIMGISLSFTLAIYTAGSLMSCFLGTAAMFVIMAVMGYTTQKDLTSFGSILRAALIGLIITMIINFFMHSSQIDYIISLAGVAIFTGLIAYKTQALKQIAMGIELNSEGTATAIRGSAMKLSILGAMSLYISFINLFLFVLRLFGRRR